MPEDIKIRRKDLVYSELSYKIMGVIRLPIRKHRVIANNKF